MHMSIGPIEYVVVGFPGNKFKGEIIPALAELVENGTIRIIDLVFILKDEEGNVAAVELADLDPEDEATAMADISDVDAGLLNEDDIALAAEELEPNSSAGLLVFENVWATRFAEAVRNADGRLLANERIPYDVVQAALAYAAAEERRAEMFMRRGPGLVRAAATTAVVAGTAGAVRHRQERRYAEQDQQRYEEQMAQQEAMAAQQAPPPGAPAADDKFAQLEKLAQLKQQGILTDEEFAAEKAKILGS
jgi:uncharacterized membrane protein